MRLPILLALSLLLDRTAAVSLLRDQKDRDVRTAVESNHTLWAGVAPATRPFALYAVMTSNTLAYQEKLATQLDTWAAQPRREGRFFAVTGVMSPEKKQEAAAGSGAASLLWTEASDIFVSPQHCQDTYQGVTCKEEELMEVGYDRSPEWLIILGEDHYVDVPHMEAVLHREQTEEPKVLGLLGCGAGTHCQFCQQVSDNGGLCGGGGYMFNRAALKQVFESEGGKDAVRKEYQEKAGTYGDMTTSCVAMRRHIPLTNLEGNVLVGWSPLTENGYRTKLNLPEDERPMVWHYSTPAVMRWLHVALKREEEQHPPFMSEEALAKAAFPDGCCCYHSAKEHEDCREKAIFGSFLEDSLSAAQRHQLEKAHFIRSRNAEMNRGCAAATSFGHSEEAEEARGKESEREMEKKREKEEKRTMRRTNARREASQNPPAHGHKESQDWEQ